MNQLTSGYAKGSCLLIGVNIYFQHRFSESFEEWKQSQIALNSCFRVGFSFVLFKCTNKILMLSLFILIKGVKNSSLIYRVHFNNSMYYRTEIQRSWSQEGMDYE